MKHYELYEEFIDSLSFSALADVLEYIKEQEKGE